MHTFTSVHLLLLSLSKSFAVACGIESNRLGAQSDKRPPVRRRHCKPACLSQPGCFVAASVHAHKAHNAQTRLQASKPCSCVKQPAMSEPQA